MVSNILLYEKVTKVKHVLFTLSRLYPKKLIYIHFKINKRIPHPLVTQNAYHTGKSRRRRKAN